MDASNQLNAGAAMIDISPSVGTHLAGSGAGDHRPTQVVIDPLFAKAIVFEAGRLEPARIGLGRGVSGDLAFNRRGIRRDGTIFMPRPLGREQQPFGISDVCYLEGPIDPEVGVCCVQNMHGKPLAFLLHYTCHPVNAYGNSETFLAASADWPGAWSREMQQAFGRDAVPLVVNGCCGNINPWHPYDPDFRPDHQRMGRGLSGLSERIVRGMTFGGEAALDTRIETIGLPFREIQAFRIGDLCIIGLPGEPFVEGQLALKLNSPASYLFPAHLTSHYVGYLPTREAYPRGGHEANEDVTYWAKLAPGCLETVIDRARGMVQELFG